MMILCKNLSNFVSLVLKLHNLYCHIERLAVYNYNPLNMLMFPTAMALNPAGTLSLRHNDFTLKIDPTQSTTKAVSCDLIFGMAIKESNVQAVKYHKLKILSSAEQGTFHILRKHLHSTKMYLNCLIFS